jgi:replicative DNA helicase
MSAPPITTPRQPAFERVSAIFRRVVENVRARTSDPELPFGIIPLDKATYGIRRGKVTILASRTSEGKTALALQTAINLADAGRTVAFVSLEDDRESLVERIYCNMARVNNGELRAGKIEQSQIDSIMPIFDRLKVLVLDNYGYNFIELEQIMSTLDPPPEVVFVDYVQMVEQEKRESEYEAVSRFVRDAKVFAERHRVGFVLVSQINRQGARDGKPLLHHLANCGRLEQVADLVLLFYTPGYYNESSWDYQESAGTGMKVCPMDYVEIEIAKNKVGPRGMVIGLRFTGSQYRFAPWAEDAEVETGEVEI